MGEKEQSGSLIGPIVERRGEGRFHPPHSIDPSFSRIDATCFPSSRFAGMLLLENGRVEIVKHSCFVQLLGTVQPVMS